MIKAISTFLDSVFKLSGNDADDETKESIKHAVNIIKTPDSFIKKAKDLTITIPVIISSGLLADGGEKVSKLINIAETNLALFLVQSLGLDSILNDSQNIRDIIRSNVGNESLNPELVYDLPNGVELKIKPVRPFVEDNDEKLVLGDDYFNYDFSKEILASNEAIEQKQYTKISKGENGSYRESRKMDYYTGSEKDKMGFKMETKEYEAFKKKNNSMPTVISLTFKKKQQENSVLIAIKCTPKFVDSSIIIEFFNSLMNDTPMKRFIQLTTGEIDFFKDFIFNMDKLSKNNEYRNKEGDFPLFTKLKERKNRNIFTAALNLLAKNLPDDVSKEVITSDNYGLPLHTIMCNSMDIVEGFGLDGDIKKFQNNKRIRNKIEKLLILALIISDGYSNNTTFMFNGIEEPWNITDNDLKNFTVNKKGDIGDSEILLKLLQKNGMV